MRMNISTVCSFVAALFILIQASHVNAAPAATENAQVAKLDQLLSAMKVAATESIQSIASLANPKNRTLSCSGNGVQIFGGYCVCFLGYTGATCQSSVAPPPPDRNPSSPRDDAESRVD